MPISRDQFQPLATGGKCVSTDRCAARLQLMTRVVQRDEVTVYDPLLQPSQQDQCRFDKHRDYPSDKLRIVLTLKLAQSLEDRFVEHGSTARFPHRVPGHGLVPLLTYLRKS